jgi:predicted alpha/beta hydrolase
VTLSCLGASAAASVPPVRKAFQTADGVYLVGDVYTQKKKAPTVIIWHMLGRNRNDVSPIIQPLLDQGFSVINMDQRGHGESVNLTNKSTINFKSFAAGEWSKMPGDAELMVQDAQKLPNIDGNKIGVIGSSIGANMAAMVSGDPHVKAIVMISPGANYHGIQPERYVKGDTKPTLMIAGQGDSDSNEAVNGWGKLRPSFKATIVRTDAHGDDLLKDATIVQQVVSFLKSHLNP